MKTKSEMKMVEIDARELAEMKAQEELMKESMRTLADDLDDARDDLETTKRELSVVTKDLRDTRQLLHSAVTVQQRSEETARQCSKILIGFLNQWLSVENRALVKNILKFYHPLQRVNMMNALLTYLIFGKKLHLEREVEKTHFKIICDRIDEDCINLPTHSLMVKLMKKYGLNETQKEIAQE